MSGSVALARPLLGCTTMEDLMELATLLEDLRQEEGAGIELNCDNPDPGPGPNAVVLVAASFTNWRQHHFTGDSVLACLRAAKEMRDSGARKH